MRKSTIIAISALAALSASTSLLANHTGLFMGVGVDVHEDTIGAESSLGIRKDTMEYGASIGARRISTDIPVAKGTQTITDNETDLRIGAYFAKIMPTSGIWSFRYGVGVGYMNQDLNGSDSITGSTYKIGAMLFTGPSVEIGQSALLNITTNVLNYAHQHEDDANGSYSKWHLMDGASAQLSYFF